MEISKLKIWNQYRLPGKENSMERTSTRNKNIHAGTKTYMHNVVGIKALQLSSVRV
jgi:hypothetical protein